MCAHTHTHTLRHSDTHTLYAPTINLLPVTTTAKHKANHINTAGMPHSPSDEMSLERLCQETSGLLSVCDLVCVCVCVCVRESRGSRRFWLQMNSVEYGLCAIVCLAAGRKWSSMIDFHSDPLTHLATVDGQTLLPAGISATFVLQSNRVELCLLRSPWRLWR